MRNIIKKIKQKFEIQNCPPLKRAVCEVLDGKWEDLERKARIGCAMLLVVYTEEKRGFKEAPNFVPYLVDNDIDFTGEELASCLETISKNNFIVDGKVRVIGTEDLESAVWWGMVGALFCDWLVRSEKNGEAYYQCSKGGLAAVEAMVKKPQTNQ